MSPCDKKALSSYNTSSDILEKRQVVCALKAHDK